MSDSLEIYRYTPANLPPTFVNACESDARSQSSLSDDYKNAPPERRDAFLSVMKFLNDNERLGPALDPDCFIDS